MNKIFVDTSGWASLADVSEPFYQKAKEIYAAAMQNRQRLVTTNYVLTELVALMTSPMRFHRPRIIEFVRGIKESPFFDIIHIDEDLDAKAWELLTNRADKNWSLSRSKFRISDARMRGFLTYPKLKMLPKFRVYLQ